MGPFLCLFFWFRFQSFSAFFRVFAVGCVISFSWCWRRAALFSVGLFCVRFCLCFLFFSGFFAFLALGAGRRAALFSVWLFVCVFVCVFSSFRASLGSFLALGAGRRAALFSVGLFVCVFVCVFSSFRAFLRSFLALGAGRRAALFFRRAFCVRFGVFVFESDSFIF